MGLLSKLGGAIKESARIGVVKGVSKALKNSAQGGVLEGLTDASFTDIIGTTRKYASDYASNTVRGRSVGVNTPNMSDKYDAEYNTDVSMENGEIIVTSNKTVTKKSDKIGAGSTKELNKANTDYESEITANNNGIDEDILDIDIPDWGYQDFINERGMWQKQITSVFGDPGYFYFKIFFKFNTQHGLLGGILNDINPLSSVNSAIKFLYFGRKHYAYHKPLERIDALFKFSSILSYISSNSPWFFKGVKGLSEAISPQLSEFSKERFIEIETMPDAIDMRLSTLLSLYKFACYDDITCSEIIPENLRKFDMSIVIFATPIRHLHTSMKYKNGYDTKTFKYKSMNKNNSRYGWSNVMSYKLITFKNCEIMVDSIGTVIPENMSNENPFQLGNNIIKIKYDKAYEHTMNEFFSVMYGSGGMLYNQYSEIAKLGIDNVISAAEEDNNLERYDAMQALLENANSPDDVRLVDASEALIHNRLKNYDNLALGNIYTEYSTVYKNYSKDGSGQMKGNTLNEYYKSKLKRLHNRLSMFESVGGNILMNFLKSSWSSAETLGNLYGDVGVGSQYWRDKLKKLHNKNHQNADTTDFLTDYQNIMNFDIRDFLYNSTRKKQ